LATSDVQSEITEILYGVENTIRRGVQFMKNAKHHMDLYGDKNGPSIIIEFPEIYKNNYIECRKRGGKIRFIADITKDNIRYCKELIRDEAVDEFRHLEGFVGGIAISESEFMTTTSLRDKQLLTQVFYSNAEEVVKQGQYIFNTFWNKAILAEQRIKEIEEGIEPSKTEIIQDTKESISRANNIIKSAKEQVLMIWATSKTFVIGMNAGVDKLYSDAISNGAIVKLLIPYGDNIETLVKDLKKVVPQVDIKIADKSLETKITILVVDKREVMTWELRDDKIENPYEAGGLATYSNNKSIASSYATIFEIFWKQTELYEQSQNFNKMQNDFVNIAAHELRTPIQPIIGLSDLLTRSNYPKEKEREMLDVIARNAKRLQRLTEDILDITRIESKSLALKKERFNLSEILRNVISDFQNQLSKEYRINNLSLEFVEPENDILVEADRGRISQIVSNLLSNAIKFTDQGKVSVMAICNEHKAIVSIKDTGPGIDPEILPRLFTKFATKSITGTGLGLYISRNIIEAHSGRIWAENNKDDNEVRGATFNFSLPIDIE
jgi:signal transduction histidine kinase